LPPPKHRRSSYRARFAPGSFFPSSAPAPVCSGNESGKFEAWVYPLKLFRDFHLTFHVSKRALPAETLARTLTVTPTSATLVYVGDSFRVRETLFVTVHEPGAVILLDVETDQPLEIEAAFVGDFALECPPRSAAHLKTG